MRNPAIGAAAVFLLGLLTACNPPSPSHSRTASVAADDSSFAEVQRRGYRAMGVDQYSSAHQFEPLPDGGRISLQRDPRDSAGVAQIRSHMREIAAAFARGNFALPGFVHDRPVPGTAIMAARRSRIIYVADTLPGGGQLRLRTSDPSAIAAIHEFLAFQRQDHRTPSPGGTH